MPHIEIDEKTERKNPSIYIKFIRKENMKNKSDFRRNTKLESSESASLAFNDIPRRMYISKKVLSQHCKREKKKDRASQEILPVNTSR